MEKTNLKTNLKKSEAKPKKGDHALFADTVDWFLTRRELPTVTQLNKFLVSTKDRLEQIEALNPQARKWAEKIETRLRKLLAQIKAALKQSS